MPLIVPKPSTIDLMKLFRGLWNLPGDAALVIGLFVNNYTPDDTTLLSDLVQCTSPGGANQNFRDWSVPVLTLAGRAQMEAPEVTWIKAVGLPTALVYGYFVTAADEVTLYWAQRFSDGPYSFVNPGDIINVTPTFAGRSEF